MRTAWPNSRGSLTLVALCFTAVIGIALASYLALSLQSMQLSQRTLQLGRARHLAETGLEEALWSLNNSTWTNATWTVTGTNISCAITGYSLGEGATGEADITILNYTGNSPTITSTGTVTLSTGAQLTKKLSATTKPAPLFPNAIGIVADNNGRVTFNSGGTVDSWNSNPSADNVTFVPYPGFPGVHNTAAVCAATVAAPRITLNNAAVYGYTTTFGSTVTVTASSQVKGPATPAATNIDPARVGKSAFVPVYPVGVPTPYSITGWLDGTSQTIGHPFHGNEEVYYCNGLDLNGTNLTIQGPVVIIVNGDLTIVSGAIIQVNSTGNSRLEMFVSGDVNIGTSPHGSTTWLKNLTNEPRNLAIYSTSTSSSRVFNYYNNHDFCGVLYSAAPNASLVFDTGTTTTIAGAVLANYHVTFANGTAPIFAYDTSLQNLPKGWFTGVTTPLIVVQITES
jgi:hypothetical protein